MLVESLKESSRLRRFKIIACEADDVYDTEGDDAKGLQRNRLFA